MKKEIFIISILLLSGVYLFGLNDKNNNYICYSNLIAKNNNLLTDDFLDSEEWWDSVKQDYIDYYGEDYLIKIKQNGDASANADIVRSFYNKDENGEFIIPNYIGGLYINDENVLVIQIVKKYIPQADEIDYSLYMKMINSIDKKIIEYVNYSENELNDLNDYIVQKLQNRDLYNSIGISKVFVDTINNSIGIGLINYNEESIEKFKNNVINSNAIYFIKGGMIVPTLNSGGAVGSCSVGYRARKSSTGKGFVTAGHCYCNNAYIGGFGTVQNRQFSGKIDAAWVNSANISITIYNTLHNWSVSSSLPLPNPPSVTTSVATPTVGQNIGRVGKASGHRVGTITSTNISFFLQYDDDCSGIAPYMTNQIDTTVFQNNGDSGGIVYYSSNRATLGIGTFKDVNTNYMIFSSAKNINSIFGITRY